MYAGYQHEKIVLVADTQEELENNKFIKFDKIEELSEPYELYNGEYITVEEATARKKQDAKEDQIKKLQAQLDSVDLKTIRALRAMSAGTGTEYDKAKLEELEAEAEDLRTQIRALINESN